MGWPIIGEACHYIDLMRFLVGNEITGFASIGMGNGTKITEDKATITLTFKDGSFGTINYFGKRWQIIC